MSDHLHPRRGLGAGLRIVYPFLSSGQAVSWSVPYRGEIEDVAGDAMEVTFDPRRQPPWSALVARGGHPVQAIDAADMERILGGYELRDLTGKRHR